MTLTIAYPGGFFAHSAYTVNGSSLVLAFSWVAVNLCGPLGHGAQR